MRREIPTRTILSNKNKDLNNNGNDRGLIFILLPPF